MFPTRVPVSEFTKRAFEDNIKALESLTFFSKTDLYAIAAGERPDHLLYARELHRGLCVTSPEAAKEYRETLDSDAALVARGARVPVTQTDSYAVSRLCQKFVDAVIREGKGGADGQDVLSDARRLHATLGAFIKAEESKDEGRQQLREIR